MWCKSCNPTNNKSNLKCQNHQLNHSLILHKHGFPWIGSCQHPNICRLTHWKSIFAPQQVKITKDLNPLFCQELHLVSNHWDIFSWSYEDKLGLDPRFYYHQSMWYKIRTPSRNKQYQMKPNCQRRNRQTFLGEIHSACQESHMVERDSCFEHEPKNTSLHKLSQVQCGHHHWHLRFPFTDNVNNVVGHI